MPSPARAVLRKLVGSAAAEFRDPLPKRVFTLWMGDNPMTDNRRRCLDSVASTQCHVILITADEVSNWVLPQAPLHPAWHFLSAVHRSDYLRAYLMHHHGGGYTDIKLTTASWLPAFDILERRQDFLGIGYPEVGAYGVASDVSPSIRRLWLKLNYRWLIGNGAFIFHPNSHFTREWFATLTQRLDRLLPRLREHPAHDPRERPGREYHQGISRYPVKWSYLMGSIFHPLAYRHRHRISNLLPAPTLVDYK